MLKASAICLNMIVRNESAIIERCLAAAAGYIDCYVILSLIHISEPTRPY